MRIASCLKAAVLLAALCLPAQAQKAAPYPVVQGKYYKFEKIADGVYYASPGFNGTIFPFGSNPFFGANLVVDKSAVIYANNTAFDITQEAIKRLDAQMPTYKVTLGGAPAKP